jgi:hypothetical protein
MWEPGHWLFLIEKTQSSLLFRKTPFYEIPLDIREIGVEQSLISIDVILVSLAKRGVEDSHDDPPVRLLSPLVFCISWQGAARDAGNKASLHCWSKECLNSSSASARERA